MSKEIIEKIKSAEENAAAMQREAEVKAAELLESARAEAERIIAEAKENGEERLASANAEQRQNTVRAAEEGRKAGAYEAARATAEANDNFEAAVSYIIGGIAG